ncbi:MAG: hypothetical protein DSY80_00580 [Desulfocapsa sp.]|nr:MAG: hypothetical protein DSY80_00580 [Desulfocapsa sp.]
MATRQEWMVKGQLVSVNGRHWYGEIVDVAVSDYGRIMLLINSPKAIWRNHRPEWLEYNPKQIAPAKATEAIASVDTYIERIEKMLEDVENLKQRWENNL